MRQNSFYKGNLNTIILKLLTEQESMYGYEITQKVKEITKGELAITEGALYPALHKLKAKGLLETDIQKVNNRLRKYYRLTKKGKKECIAQVSALEAYLENLQLILNPKLRLS